MLVAWATDGFETYAVGLFLKGGISRCTPQGRGSAMDWNEGAWFTATGPCGTLYVEEVAKGTMRLLRIVKIQRRSRAATWVVQLALRHSVTQP